MKYDIARLRKKLGLNQKQLSEKLGIRQSFLSAIENGKSPLPSDKESRLMEIVHSENLEEYVISDISKGSVVQNEFNAINETNMFKELLNYFHSQAHKEKDEHHELLHVQLNSYQERNDRLTEKNEALQLKIEGLNDKIEKLRDELLQVRSENLRLKEQLLSLK